MFLRLVSFLFLALCLQYAFAVPVVPEGMDTVDLHGEHMGDNTALRFRRQFGFPMGGMGMMNGGMGGMGFPGFASGQEKSWSNHFSQSSGGSFKNSNFMLFG